MAFNVFSMIRTIIQIIAVLLIPPGVATLTDSIELSWPLDMLAGPLLTFVFLFILTLIMKFWYYLEKCHTVVAKKKSKKKKEKKWNIKYGKWGMFMLGSIISPLLALGVAIIMNLIPILKFPFMLVEGLGAITGSNFLSKAPESLTHLLGYGIGIAITTTLDKKLFPCL